jgi:LytR cell envelope-related transcriptional attenuator
VDHAQRTVVSSHRRRQRRRATITLTFVVLAMIGTFAYAAAYFQGWVAFGTPPPVASPACQVAAPAKVVTPGAVTINVYNATNRNGLAASVAKSLRRQGFKVHTIANDPLGKQIAGVGEVRHGQPGATGAKLAALSLPGATVILDYRTDDTVDLVLGDRFSALRTLPKGATSQATKPAPLPSQSC